MIEFLAGAVTLGYAIAASCFLRFWWKTRDRLFIHFSFAFFLFALNQLLTVVLTASDERTGYVYVLRVLGFVVILVGIAGKNSFSVWRK